MTNGEEPEHRKTLSEIAPNKNTSNFSLHWIFIEKQKTEIASKAKKP